MQGDVGLLTILLTKVALDLPGQLMRATYSHLPVHPTMRLNSDVVSNVASTQVVWRTDSRCLTDDRKYLIFHLLGQI